jgi:hypothetical protein
MPPVLALLSDFNLEVLQHRFSSGLGDKREARGEVQVSAYEFADFTDDYGLVQSLQRLLDPETVKVERSNGTRVELLVRSVIAEGALVADLAEATPVRNAFEQQLQVPFPDFSPDYFIQIFSTNGLSLDR